MVPAFHGRSTRFPCATNTDSSLAGRWTKTKTVVYERYPMSFSDMESATLTDQPTSQGQEEESGPASC